MDAVNEVAQERWCSIDFLRYVAAFGIVWAHMLNPDPIATVGYSALALFLMLVPFLSIHHIGRKDRPAGKRPALIRIKRILVPWIFWSLFFKVILALQMRDPMEVFRLHDPQWLLIGSTIHLWFLPFIFVVTALFIPLSQSIKSAKILNCVCVAAFAISLACMYAHDFGQLPEPLGQWAFALPPYLYGLLAACGRRIGQTLAPMIFFVSLATTFWVLGDSYWPPHFIVALLVFESALRVRGKRSDVLTTIGSLAFGIYLMHPFFMLVWFRIFGASNHAIPGVIFVFAVSSLTAYLMRRTPYVRQVV